MSVSKAFVTEKNYTHLCKKLCLLEAEFVIGNSIKLNVVIQLIDDIIDSFNNLLIIKHDIIGKRASITKDKYYNLHEKLCLLENLFLIEQEINIDHLTSSVDNVIEAFNELLL
jgi:hypothetical protein